MTGRPIVRDMTVAEPVTSCPGCNASVAAVPRSDLRRVVLPCRCHRGHETYELRCPSCARLVVLHALPSGMRAVLPDQHGALATLRDAGREDVARSVDRLDDRDR